MDLMPETRQGTGKSLPGCKSVGRYFYIPTGEKSGRSKRLVRAVHTVFNKSPRRRRNTVQPPARGEAGGLLQETIIKLQETPAPLKMKNGENKKRPMWLHKGLCKDLRL